MEPRLFGRHTEDSELSFPPSNSLLSRAADVRAAAPHRGGFARGCRAESGAGHTVQGVSTFSFFFFFFWLYNLMFNLPKERNASTLGLSENS